MAYDSQTVSWQSAFWAIALLALNNITQASDEVFASSNVSRPGFSASPFYCLIDAADILVFIAGEFWESASPRRALRKAASRRGWYVNREKDKDPHRRVSLELLILRTAIRVGAFTQLVKLMGFRGLPWTKSFAIMYATDYVLREIVVWHAGPPGPDASPRSLPMRPAPEGNDLLFKDDWLLLARLLHCELMLFILIQLDVTRGGWCGHIDFVSMVYYAMLHLFTTLIGNHVICMIFMILSGCSKWGQTVFEMESRIRSVVVLPTAAFTYGVVPLVQHLARSWNTVKDQRCRGRLNAKSNLAAQIFEGMMLAIWMLFVGIEMWGTPLLTAWKERAYSDKPLKNGIAPIYVTTSSLFGAFLYYRFVYTDACTHRSWWTDNLG